MLMRLYRLWVVCLAFVAAVSVTRSGIANAETESAIALTLYSAADYYAAGEDIVFDGTILSAQEVSRQYAETCGTTGYMPITGTEIRVRVDEVLYGVAETNTLEVTILDQGFGDVVGQRVRVRAHRLCDDAWRLNGWMDIIRPDGEIVDKFGRPAFQTSGMSEGESIRLESAGPTSATVKHPAGVINGAGAIALAVVDSIQAWTPDGSRYWVRGLRWLFGEAPKLPSVVAFPKPFGCQPNIRTADSLVVPVPVGAVGDTVNLDRCPSALLVRDWYVPGYGVWLEQLELALEPNQPTVMLRSILREER